MRAAVVMFLAFATPVGAQESTLLQTCSEVPSAPVVAGPNMSEYAAGRENALAPGNAAMRCHDYERALQLYELALAQYHEDARALNITAQAAFRAGQGDKALTYFRKSLALNANYSWSTRTSLMQELIALQRWPELEAERLETRKASLAGDRTLPAATGYQIETIATGKEFIRTIEFATPQEPNHTRDRFVLYERKDVCTGVTPSFDLESGDDGNFYLRAYPRRDGDVPLRVYVDREPTYQQLRADVLLASQERPPVRKDLVQPCGTGQRMAIPPALGS